MTGNLEATRLKFILSVISVIHFIVFIYTEQIISLIICSVFMFLCFNIVQPLNIEESPMNV